MWLRNAGFRPDDEHAVVLDAPALGVEQIGDAVQRHHRLAGTRAALDHQHAGVVEPDDFVLLGLDRRDDVAHPVAAWRVHRRQQRASPAAATLSRPGRPRTSSVKSTT
jgi:hypothetical protein